MSAVEEIQTVRFSEDEIALEFTVRHGPEWRYVAKWNKWFRWTGTVWMEDERLQAFNLIRDLCREIALTENEQKPKRVAARTVAGVHALVRTDPHHAAGVDQWDRKPDLLGAKSRTIDLNTGLDKDPDPLDYITKRAVVDPGGDCPKWLTFLDRVTNGDADLQAYLQRACGYCLTGLTSEHVIFFLYGTGANGKSVFVETMSGVLGDYAVTATTQPRRAISSIHGSVTRMRLARTPAPRRPSRKDWSREVSREGEATGRSDFSASAPSPSMKGMNRN